MGRDSSQRALQLFDELVQLPREQRSALLRERCDEPATCREVESLLAAYDDAGEFLSERPPAPEAEPCGVGSRIGHYELIELLGEGGFARVYRARQHHPVRRDVALKLVKLGMDTSAVIARFKAERQALALMDHPGIAAVYDAGATETGRPYFVMELVRGQRINRHCDEQLLDVRQRVRLFADVCRAVHHAHTKGLLHRDLKPSNILVTTVDGQAVPKVIDFGVAKATQQPLTDATLLTHACQILGTPQYMSPEQALSGGSDVDTRSDIYSLGAVLYELLTGVTPLESSTKASGSLEQLQRLISGREEPARPSTRFDTPGADDRAARAAASRGLTADSLRRTLRGELDWIITKCLDRDRTRRYDSAAALADDLLAYLEHRPITAAPPTLAYRARTFARRNTAVVLLSALVLFTLLAGMIASATQAYRATRAERLAQQRLIDAQAASATLRAVNDFLTQDMIGSADPAVARGADLSVRAALGKAAAAVPARFADQPLIEAAVRYSIADAYLTLGQPALALPHAEHVLDVRRRLLGEEHPDTIAALNCCAIAHYHAGRAETSEPLARAALEASRRTLGPDHPHTLTSLNNCANAVIALGRWADAEPLAREAWARSRGTLGDEHDKTLTWQNNYGRVLQMLDRLSEAEAIFRETWERRGRLAGEDHPDTLTALNNLALVLKQQGRLPEAQPLYQKALALRRRVFGDDHPDTLASLHNYASLLRALQQYDEAQPLVEETLARRRRTQGEDHPHTLLALTACAENLRALGRIDEALALHAEGLDRRRRILGEGHPDTLVALSNYALALQSAGRPTEAEPLHREVLHRRQSLLGEDHRHTLSSLNNVARVVADAGRPAEAEPLARQALERHRRVLGPDHPDTLLVLSNYALLLEATGRDADAEPLWAELSQRAAAAGAALRLPPGVVARYVSFHGPCLARMGRYQSAEAPLREALARLRQTRQEDSPRMRAVLAALAEVCDHGHRPDEAARWRAELAALEQTPSAATAPASGGAVRASSSAAPVQR